MKYFIKDYMEEEDAYELPPKIDAEHDPWSAAQVAEIWNYTHDGWKCDWPLSIVLIDENGRSEWIVQKYDGSVFFDIPRKDEGKTKFIKGQQIHSMTLLALLLDADTWIYMHGRPKHPGFIVSMQYRCLRNLVKLGKLYEAIPREKYEGRKLSDQ